MKEIAIDRTHDALTSPGSAGIPPLNVSLGGNIPTLLGCWTQYFQSGPIIGTQFNGTYRISVSNVSSLPSSIRFEATRLGPECFNAVAYSDD
ncbi:hypothetical protein [Paenibacillus illinoisensis]|uniref:hypothetical protein n=1 Tax=Paenibacillus illinoisensis TaxID=59845 RepID=UPI00301CC660